jgi:hypothetical protein
MERHWGSSLFVLVSGLGLGLTLAAAPASAGHVLDIRALGSGSATGTCITGFLAPRCTVESTGEIMATYLGHGPAQSDRGTFTLELTAGLQTFAQNSEGGQCFVAHRATAQSAVLFAANGETIDLNTVGTLCEENGLGTSLHYNGTYSIVGGTGRFLGAVGGGSLTATFERDFSEIGSGGATFLKLEGTIRSR